MKNLTSIVVVAIMVVTLTSCRNAEKEKVETAVDDYTAYIDSVSNIALKDASLRWDEIDSSVSDRKNKAENELQTLTNKSQYEPKMEESSNKYDAFKQNVLAEKQRTDASNAKQVTRNSLFKNANVGDDLNFNWVNKDNILNVYDHFVTTTINNKDSYSREEWDEIKILYEALDSRKNTVENEGLTTADNLKIAALKVQFAPMYEINRAGAKSQENKEVKE